MKKFTVVISVIFMLFHTSEGVKRMREYPFPAYEYAFNKPVIFMFPMIRLNTIGIYYGLEDEENVAGVTLKDNRLDREVLKIDGFDDYVTAVFPQVQRNQLVASAKMAIRILDLEKRTLDVDYMPDMPNDDIDFEYINGKVLSGNNQIVLSLFSPFITPENESYYCLSLVLEDLKNKKVLKRLRLNEESEETIFLGKKHSYFLECAGDTNQIQYLWRVVDDNLDFVDHPLVPILDKQWNHFYPNAILISESQECAIARGYPKFPGDKYGPTQFQITPWIDKRPPVPIVLPDGQCPSQYISKETFLLSPSGKWLFFVAAKPGLPTQGPEHYYLMYIDKSLPNYYLPPIEIETGGEHFKVTWMQEPEGFVLWNGKHLRYWDLSKFEAGKFIGK